MVVCCVPGCETGTAAYKKRLKEQGGPRGGEPLISLFKVPNNPKALESWEQAIPKLNRNPLSFNCSVCALHFRPENVITHYETKLTDGTINIIPRGRALLKSGAVPTHFPNMPSSNSTINGDPLELSEISSNKRKHASLSPIDDGALLNNDPTIKKVNGTYSIVEAFVKSELEVDSISINELINDAHRETESPELSEISSDESKFGSLRPIRGAVPLNSPIIPLNSTINREPPELSEISRKHASLRPTDFPPNTNEGVLLNDDPTVEKVNGKYFIVKLEAFVKSELEEDSFSINNLINDTKIKTPSKMWAKTYIEQKNEVLYAEWDECYCPKKKLIVARDMSFKVVLGKTEIQLYKPFTKITKYEDVEDLMGTIHEINL